MSINKVTLIGNVGKDPEIKTVTSDNIKVATFSLATSEGTKEHPVTLWHNIKCWNKLAEVVEIYVKKGSKLYVEGSIFYREWEKDGVKHSATDINCQKIELLDSHKENGEKAPSKALVDEMRKSQKANNEPHQQELPLGENNNDLPF